MSSTNKKTQGPTICPICQEKRKTLVLHFDQRKDQPLLEAIQREKPNWQAHEGICNRCLNRYHQACLNILKSEKNLRGHQFGILPIPVLLNANPQYTGKGICICFIDSGIYYHPDLMLPDARIIEVKDMTVLSRKETWFEQPHNSNWHGTMTTTVCAGNGQLSGGRYRGIASEGQIVLLKVMAEKGGISEGHIIKALQWVLDHHEEYRIKILNLSISADFPESFQSSPVDILIKKIFERGITIVAAIGNDPQAAINPPANAPEVLAIGGLDQHNTLDPMQASLYHSTYGTTVDGLLKPDLIAPSIRIPAPILPQTPSQIEAAAIFSIIDANSSQVKEQLQQVIERTDLPKALLEAPIEEILQSVNQYAKRQQYISAHYKEVDGTSFAAPIVCSVIAQMLEANPKLSPEMIREMLLSSARPLSGVAAEQQGYGVLHAAGAVALASGAFKEIWKKSSPFINYKERIISFHFYHERAHEVTLMGDFDQWSDGIALQKTEDGLWEKTLPVLPAGVYQYKYLIDHREWSSDPANAYRCPDGFNGFNSLLIIE